MHQSTRIDDGIKYWTVLEIKMKSRTVVGGGGVRSACYVTPDPSYDREGAGEAER